MEYTQLKSVVSSKLFEVPFCWSIITYWLYLYVYLYDEHLQHLWCVCVCVCVLTCDELTHRCSGRRFLTFPSRYPDIPCSTAVAPTLVLHP